jgi:hypothetical protein
VLDHIDEPNDVWMSKLTKRKDFITESFKIKSRYARLDNFYSEDLLPNEVDVLSGRFSVAFSASLLPLRNLARRAQC